VPAIPPSRSRTFSQNTRHLLWTKQVAAGRHNQHAYAHALPIRKIRDIRGSEKSTNFPRNISPDFLHYIAERPEMVSHDEEAQKAKTTNKRKIKI